jgi:O-acetyl-ADP-ribose deacetylase (regulator of RNase III)
MLRLTEKNVFNCNTQFIVNTVNTEGVMGAGLALEFKLRYPSMFEDYLDKCKKEQISVDHVDYHIEPSTNTYIINFSTKKHWRYPSQIQWIEKGLQDFVQTYKEKNVTSVAFPKLGCDKGGLDWKDVEPLMRKYLEKLDIPVWLCLDTHQPEGLEEQMLTFLKEKMGPIDLKALKFNEQTIYAIKNIVHELVRFRDLTKVCNLKQYEKIYTYVKDRSSDMQMSLF